jgi:hypothetical protein
VPSTSAPAALAEGNLALAREHLDAALPLARASGYRDAECFIVIELAQLTRREGKWEDAAQLLGDARTLNATLGSRDKEANIYAELGRLQRDLQQSEVARQSFAAALSIWEAAGQGKGYEARKTRAELAALDAKPKPKRRW